MMGPGNPGPSPPPPIARSANGAAIAALAIALAFPCAAEAAPIETRPVKFARGSSTATMTGTLEGDRVVDYKVRAGVGHTLSVTLAAAHGAGHFDLFSPGSPDKPFFVGSTEGNAWSGFLLAHGEYTIRVYPARDAAQAGGAVDYSLAVGIAARPRVPRALIRALTSDPASKAVSHVHVPATPGG
jgi:hypothetical protein